VAKVVLFSTPTCSWCPRAKKYFRENRVAFREIYTDFSNYYATVHNSSTGR
jgi:glutaredoxin